MQDWPFDDLTSAVASLSSPEFVDVRGYVLRISRQWTAESLQTWIASGSRVAAIEDVLNHLHLWDELDTDGLDDVQLRRASEAIAESWRAELKREFPERQFRVVVTDDYGPGVTCSSENTA